MERTQTTTKNTTHTVKVSADDIRALVGAPMDADVFIYVPSGGDYSRTDLAVDGQEQAVQVRWTVKEE